MPVLVSSIGGTLNQKFKNGTFVELIDGPEPMMEVLQYLGDSFYRVKHPEIVDFIVHEDELFAVDG